MQHGKLEKLLHDLKEPLRTAKTQPQDLHDGLQGKKPGDIDKLEVGFNQDARIQSTGDVQAALIRMIFEASSG